jgi:hypothetical protein
MHVVMRRNRHYPVGRQSSLQGICRRHRPRRARYNAVYVDDSLKLTKWVAGLD